MVANYEKRREHLKTALAETSQKLADHEQGRSLLEDEEYERLQKRMGLFEKKLEKMEEPMDEREIEKVMERMRMRDNRRHMEL